MRVGGYITNSTGRWRVLRKMSRVLSQAYFSGEKPRFGQYSFDGAADAVLYLRPLSHFVAPLCHSRKTYILYVDAEVLSL